MKKVFLISIITKIIKFEELSCIRLILKAGYHKLYPKSELDIQKNSLKESIMSIMGENVICIAMDDFIKKPMKGIKKLLRK